MPLITIVRSAEVLPRPKRPVYWSALGVVLAGTIISVTAMLTFDKVLEAVSVVNSVILIFVAMARGFFGGGDDKPTDPKEDST